MSKDDQHVASIPLSDSERSPLPKAKKAGPADPDERMTVTVIVHRPSVSQVLDKIKTAHFSQKSPISHEAFGASFGAGQTDLDKVKTFARVHHLNVKEVNAAAGTILLEGTASSFGEAFGVQLDRYEHPDFSYRGRTGPIHIPKSLEGVVEAVLGLDNRPQVRTHFKILRDEEKLLHANRAGQSYTPPQVARLYQFPDDVDCSRQCIGIIELGGGYRADELRQYFSSLDVAEPAVKEVPVGEGSNQPTGDPNGPDGEVVLDIEIAGAVAPGVTIAVYFAPNTDAGFLNALNRAIHDTENKPSVISISWGSAESRWTIQAMKAMDRAFQDAAVLGITVLCAAGDQGSADGINDGLVHVDFPASSPHVLGCGGTKLEGTDEAITSEIVWDEGPGSSTGGGVSQIFDLPDWQSSVRVPPSANPGGKKGRGVPDVAGDADPVTGYRILVDGQQAVIGGTSAVAPLWAGLAALINQGLGHSVGFINAFLYRLPAESSALRDITEGNNGSSREKGAYEAGKGWDACTGLGSPVGTNIMNNFLNLSDKT